MIGSHSATRGTKKSLRIDWNTAISHQTQHTIAVAVESVPLRDGMFVCIHYKFVSAKVERV